MFEFLFSGVAELVSISFTGCTTAPCAVTAGTEYDLDIQFKPRDFHWDLTLYAILTKEAELEVIYPTTTLPDSTVNAGELYDFNFHFRAPSTSFSGVSQGVY